MEQGAISTSGTANTIRLSLNRLTGAIRTGLTVVAVLFLLKVALCPASARPRAS